MLIYFVIEITILLNPSQPCLKHVHDDFFFVTNFCRSFPRFFFWNIKIQILHSQRIHFWHSLGIFYWR